MKPVICCFCGSGVASVTALFCVYESVDTATWYFEVRTGVVSQRKSELECLQSSEQSQGWKKSKVVSLC